MKIEPVAVLCAECAPTDRLEQLQMDTAILLPKSCVSWKGLDRPSH